MSLFQGATLYYFNNVLNKSTCGRGEAVRLLLTDAGIDFKYQRVDFPDWLSMKQKLISSNDRVPTLPYLTTKSGQVYGRTAPLMRRISKEIGKYVPSNLDDEYLVDSCSDLCLDWRCKWVDVCIINASNEDVRASYEKEYQSFQYSNWNNILGDREEGPYVLGEEITYVDFMLYSLLKDDCDLKIDSTKYPNIDKFIKAFEARPSLNGKLQ